MSLGQDYRSCPCGCPCSHQSNRQESFVDDLALCLANPPVLSAVREPSRLTKVIRFSYQNAGVGLSSSS